MTTQTTEAEQPKQPERPVWLPDHYKGQTGTPLFWMHWYPAHAAPVRDAISAYLNYVIDGTPFSQEQLETMKHYLRYWIKAPCWQQAGTPLEKLQALRESLETVTNGKELDAWLMDQCMPLIGDPL